MARKRHYDEEQPAEEVPVDVDTKEPLSSQEVTDESITQMDAVELTHLELRLLHFLSCGEGDQQLHTHQLAEIARRRAQL